MKLRYYILIGVFSFLILYCLYRSDLIDLKTATTYGVVEMGIAAFVYWLTERSKTEQRKYEIEVKQKEKEAEQQAEIIKNHTSKLIGMIQEWQKLLPEISPTEETKCLNRFEGFDISFVENIEHLDYFKDFFYHYQDFKRVWEEFVSLSNSYSSGKQALFDLIEEEINRKLISQNFNIKSEINNGFHVSVFREIIIEVNNKKSGYKHFKDEANLGGIIKYQVYYCKAFEGGNRDYQTCHLLAITGEPKKIEDVHKELIKECKEQYIDKSKELVL